jgi:aspartyl/asparaginyl-tRNA synthetase
MKKLIIPLFIPCILFLIFATVFICSCSNQEEKYLDSLFNKRRNSIESTIDFNQINSLNESNKKTMKLATITFYQIRDRETLQLVLKIKKDHQKMDSELKKLAEKNLIIIPQIVYDGDIKPDSIKKINIDFYLLNLLGNQMKNQIALLDKIEKTSQNTDFKILAIKSKKIAQSNNEALQTYIPAFYKRNNQLGLR